MKCRLYTVRADAGQLVESFYDEFATAEGAKQELLRRVASEQPREDGSFAVSWILRSEKGS